MPLRGQSVPGSERVLGSPAALVGRPTQRDGSCGIPVLPAAPVRWSKPSEVKTQFGSASILQDRRVVFNIGGNKYHIVVCINYPYRIVYIRFIGTHRQYDAI